MSFNPDVRCYWDLSQNSGYDNHWGMEVIALGLKYGYQVYARGDKINYWDSPPNKIVFEFNNPYIDIATQGGLGYNFGESKLDFAFANDRRSQNVAFLSSGMNDTARVKTTNNNITLTYSIYF
jgi:hypothetical protein